MRIASDRSQSFRNRKVRAKERAKRTEGDLFLTPIDVKADPFEVGSPKDPGEGEAEGATRNFARWPDRPEPSPVASDFSSVQLSQQSPAMCLPT